MTHFTQYKHKEQQGESKGEKKKDGKRLIHISTVFFPDPRLRFTWRLNTLRVEK